MIRGDDSLPIAAGDGWEASVARAERILRHFLVGAPLSRLQLTETQANGRGRRGTPPLDALGARWRRRVAAAVAQAAHAAALTAAWFAHPLNKGTRT